MIILVTGDREWDNIEVVYTALQLYSSDVEFLVHGYARGADSVAHVVAETLGIKTVSCPAHWRHNETKWTEIYGPCDVGCEMVEGRAAGAIRNRFMLHTYSPHRVLAFHDDLARSRGTKDMVTIARKAKIPVEHYSQQGLVCVY
jgi:hypothetical protein